MVNLEAEKRMLLAFVAFFSLPQGGVDGGALPQGPFIPALGSALRCEPGPGHLDMRGPPPASHMAPVTSDDG